MAIPENINFNEFAPWFVDQIHTSQPETIYDGKYYDTDEDSLSKAEPSSVQLHLRKNSIIRNGHDASQRNLYDFSLERMALHEIIATLLTHYEFENKEHFEDVCGVLEEEITGSQEFVRLREEYKHYSEMVDGHPIRAHLQNMPRGTTTNLAQVDFETKSREYKEHIAAFRTILERHEPSGPLADMEALAKKQDEWALMPEDQYTDKLVWPALREEARIKWKERALHTLICGEDAHHDRGDETAEDPFEQGLLARMVKKLASTPPQRSVPDAAVTVSAVAGLHSAPGGMAAEPGQKTDEAYIAELFSELKPLAKFSNEDRKSFLVVGGQGAGKSTIVSQIRKELGEEAAAMLNTDWIKSMLMEPDVAKVDVTQLGSILHAESSLVFDRAAEIWRNDAKEHNAAAHLIAEAAEAASWQTDLASTGGTRTDIRVAAVPQPEMETPLKRAYRRAQQGGDDEGRFSPTPILLASHGRRLFDTNLEAIKKGMPLTFYNTIGTPETAAAPGQDEYREPKAIATCEAGTHMMIVESLPDMLGYFANRDLNMHATDFDEIWRGTPVATAGNMLKYVRHMSLTSNTVDLAYDRDSHKFTFVIDSWGDFCSEMRGEDNAKLLIRGLAEQHTLDNKNMPVFSVDFVPSEIAKKSGGKAQEIEGVVQPIVEETHRQVMAGELDSSSRFHTFGRQLRREWNDAGNNSPAIDALKRYAAALEQLAEGAALSHTRDLRVIHCKPWMQEAYPHALEFLRGGIPADTRPTESESQYLTFDTQQKFADSAHIHKKLGMLEAKLEQDGRHVPDKDYAGIHLVRADLLNKFYDRAEGEDSGVELYGPKIANYVAAFQVSRDTPIFERLPAGLGEQDLGESIQMAAHGKWEGDPKESPRPEHSQWLILPSRQRADLRNALNAFFAAVEQEKPDWEKALHCLFHADGSARFGCSIIDHDPFVKNFQRATQERGEEYRAALTKIVTAYRENTPPKSTPGAAKPTKAKLESRLVRDPSDDRIYFLVRPERGKTYHLSTPDSRRARTVKGKDWFGIEVPQDQPSRDRMMDTLNRQLTYHEPIDHKNHAIIMKDDAGFVTRCCRPHEDDGQAEELADAVVEALEEQQEEESTGPAGDKDYRGHRATRWKRRNGMHPSRRGQGYRQ